MDRPKIEVLHEHDAHECIVTLFLDGKEFDAFECFDVDTRSTRTRQAWHERAHEAQQEMGDRLSPAYQEAILAAMERAEKKTAWPPTGLAYQAP